MVSSNRDNSLLEDCSIGSAYNSVIELLKVGAEASGNEKALTVVINSLFSHQSARQAHDGILLTGKQRRNRAKTSGSAFSN